MPAYRAFKIRHPEYAANGVPPKGEASSYWSRLDALASGGRKLLADDKIMADVFPRHNQEHESIYAERKRRALYIGYAGHVLGYLVSHLFSQEISMEIDTGEATEDGKPVEKPTPDPFYEDFAEDVSKPGGQSQSLNELLKQQIMTALKKRRAWVLVDLPQPEQGEAPATLAEQEEAGLLSAYVVPVEPECVLDWETDDTGTIVWALMVTVTQRRSGLTDARNMRTETYTELTPKGWRRYAFTWDVTKQECPKDDEESKDGGSGTWDLGAVPLVPLELPTELWLMDNIEAAVRAHFNLRSALNWAENKVLHPFLAILLAKREKGEVPQGGMGDDPGRGTKQTMGIGYTWIGRADDKLQYVAPPTDSFTFAGEDLSQIRDEIYRVVTVMAQSVDNKGAALKRSGESKKMDTAAMAIVLEALGDYMRAYAEQIYGMVQAIRKEPKKVDWCARGQEKYDDVDSSSMLDEAMTLDTIKIPSATFQVEYLSDLAKRQLGDRGDDEIIAKIREELEGHFTQDQFDNPDPMLDVPPPAPGAKKPPPKPTQLPKPTPPPK